MTNEMQLSLLLSALKYDTKYHAPDRKDEGSRDAMVVIGDTVLYICVIRSADLKMLVGLNKYLVHVLILLQGSSLNRYTRHADKLSRAL